MLCHVMLCQIIHIYLISMYIYIILYLYMPSNLGDWKWTLVIVPITIGMLSSESVYLTRKTLDLTNGEWI
jgi:hypothetical protein